MPAESPERARPEAWVVAAWALIAAELALAIYLGLKRPGAGPVRAYTFGPLLLVGGALAVGFVGAVTSAMRRPFARPQRVVAFCVVAFVVASASFPLPFPAHRADRPSRVAFSLPVRGEWTVAWGGEDDASFVLRTRPDRCYGYVLVVEAAGATRANAAEPRSAFAFGQTVLAPCDGVVAATLDRWPDDGRSASDDLGNWIALEVAPGEYFFLACLEHGSLAVEPGARVTRGQVLARVGWSAASRLAPEPHLALHLQDTPRPLAGQGVPFEFHDFFVGERRVERGRPRGKGLFVGYPLQGERVRAP
jgi:hypothetical protein